MSAIGHTSHTPYLPTERTGMNVTWGWTRLAIAYALLEAALWTAGDIQRVFSLAFLGWVIATTIAQRPSLNEIGLGIRGLRGASIALLYTGAAMAIMVTLASGLHTLAPIAGARVLPHTAGYVLWSFIQEFILNAYFFATLEKLLGNSEKAAAGAVTLFVFAHLPNPVLMLGTLLLSVVFVNIFGRHRNIYPLGLGHAVLGLTLALTIPDALLAHMRVGLGFLHLVLK